MIIEAIAILDATFPVCDNAPKEDHVRLILRTGWSSEALSINPGTSLCLEMQSIAYHRAQELIEAAANDSRLEVVCRTDEEMGILHAALAALGLKHLCGRVPDLPLPEYLPKADFGGPEDEDRVLVCEWRHSATPNHISFVFVLYTPWYPF